MHYKLEIIMPPTDDVEGAVEKIMEPFSEYNEDSKHTFWDFYSIGGRWAGNKVEARIDPKILEEFYQWCKDEKITVSSVQCGKQTLSPADQIPKVDEKWQEMTGLDGPCLIFDHAGSGYGSLDGDVCKLSELPEGYTASHVIIADNDGRVLLMLEDLLWRGDNGTDWDGKVQSAIDKCEVTPTEDWLAVTVDYHS